MISKNISAIDSSIVAAQIEHAEIAQGIGPHSSGDAEALPLAGATRAVARKSCRPLPRVDAYRQPILNPTSWLKTPRSLWGFLSNFIQTALLPHD
jgi:hypothetical protein